MVKTAMFGLVTNSSDEQYKKIKRSRHWVFNI